MTQSSQQDSLFPTSYSEDPPAKTYQWQEIVLAWTENAAACFENKSALPMSWDAIGSFGKTSLAHCPPTKEQTSPPSCGNSQECKLACQPKDGAKQGCVSDQNVPLCGGALTLNISESPSVAVESSLSAVLEDWHDDLLKFCLSAKAASGILRRANRRGRDLPPLLADALSQIAGGAR